MTIDRNSTLGWLAPVLTGLVVALIAGGSLYLLPPGGSESAKEGVTGPSEAGTFNGFAAARMERNPESWRVPGKRVLVVPGNEAEETLGTPVPEDQVGEVLPLPTNIFEQTEVWDSPLPEAEGEEPGRVVADRGPALLACTEWDNTDSCAVTVGHEEDRTFIHDLTLGSDEFQEKGHGMEVFTLPTYTEFGQETLVVAGSSEPAKKAVVVLAGGTRIELDVTDKVGNPDGAIAFGRVTGEPKRVMVYDVKGKILINHRLRECAPDENCEVR